MQISKEKKAEELESAFSTFNALSAQLAESYQALEHRVSVLTEELNKSRHERERQLAEKERLANRLSLLLDLLPGGVVVLDGEGTITECNPAALALLGGPLIGEPWHDVIMRSFEPDINEGSEINLRNGKRITINSQSLGNEPGKIVLMTDITEQHAMQTMLNRHYRLSTMGDMAASLAHQIRTPLATAMLYISHLNKPVVDDADRLRTLDKVISRLRYLDHMVNDMLQYVKSGTFEMESVDLGRLLDDVTQSLEPQIKLHKGQLKIDRNLRNKKIKGNHDALLGALINIVNNAIQVKGAGIIVTIGFKEIQAGKLKMTIADNGPGIDKDIISDLFTPFFTTRPDGTGLGLAVVHTIIEAHQGYIDAVNQARGAVFTVCLPLANQGDVLGKAFKSDRSCLLELARPNEVNQYASSK
ncbi:Flagellar sensor histidine kinase FleS [hydrothermal vent metagenome]|uniref:Flagellar sensor histidine kinase FleS n=1 Tax=hydrothermal vent metagenome TaxID=652676 RepID=A0A3B0Y5H0_9ZZZZ